MLKLKDCPPSPNCAASSIPSDSGLSFPRLTPACLALFILLAGESPSISARASVSGEGSSGQYPREGGKKALLVGAGEAEENGRRGLPSISLMTCEGEGGLVCGDKLTRV